MNYLKILSLCLAASAAAVQPALAESSLRGAPEVRIDAHDCTDSALCPALWRDMSADQRAQIWKFMDNVLRDVSWACMSGREKAELQARLPESDRIAIRYRFTAVPDGSEPLEAEKRRADRDEDSAPEWFF